MLISVTIRVRSDRASSDSDQLVQLVGRSMNTVPNSRIASSTIDSACSFDSASSGIMSRGAATIFNPLGCGVVVARSSSPSIRAPASTRSVSVSLGARPSWKAASPNCTSKSIRQASRPCFASLAANRVAICVSNAVAPTPPSLLMMLTSRECDATLLAMFAASLLRIGASEASSSAMSSGSGTTSCAPARISARTSASDGS